LLQEGGGGEAAERESAAEREIPVIKARGKEGGGEGRGSENTRERERESGARLFCLCRLLVCGGNILQAPYIDRALAKQFLGSLLKTIPIVQGSVAQSPILVGNFYKRALTSARAKESLPH